MSKHCAEYGDIFRVLVNDFGNERWLACEFVEHADDGTRWFRCLCETDGVRGDDTFPDYYQEVYDVQYCCKPDDERFYIGAGI